jgi:peptide/nickel transport system permease protein
MHRYIVRRLLSSIVMILLVTLVTFIVAYKVPGNPARLIAGQHAKIEQVRAVEHQLGLDQPLPLQYLKYMGRLLRADLGISLKTQNPVSEDIGRFFAATLELTTAAMLVTIALGVPLGIISAVKRNRPADHLARLFSLFGVSVPIYWLALLLQLTFGKLPWVPIFGRVAIEVERAHPLQTHTGLYTLDALLAGNWPFLGSALLHLVLPTLCIAYPALVLVTRMTRATVIEVLMEDYVRTARAKGLKEHLVVIRHALPNAMMPVLTMIGLAYGTMLGGTFLVEQVFGWPGIGQYAVSAAQNADYPAIMGVTILAALIYNLVNALVDLGYGIFDPRVRLSQS